MIGKQSIEVPRGHHRIKCETPFPLLISAAGEPVKALAAGSHSFVARTAEACTIEIDPTEPKKPFMLSIKSKETPAGERLDDLPPPDAPAPDNYLQQLRYKVRQQMGITREAFAERPSPYEIGELPPLFEEEEKAAAEKRAALKKAKAEKAAAELEAKAKAGEAGEALAASDDKKPGDSAPVQKAETATKGPE